jgi:hypothetical protein
VSPVNYELSFCIPEDYILHSHRCQNLKSYMFLKMFRTLNHLQGWPGNYKITVQYFILHLNKFHLKLNVETPPSNFYRHL